VLKVKKIVLIISLLSLLVLTSCTVQIGGDYTTFNEVLNLEDEKEYKVDFNFNGASVDITKTDKNLFEGEFKTNILSYEPKLKLENNTIYFNDSLGKNIIIGNNKKIWDIKLNDSVAYDMKINSNACNNSFDFTDLNIKNLDMFMNAAKTNIRFDKENKEVIEKIKLKMNSGKLVVNGLENTNANEIFVDANASKVELNFNDSFNESMEISIKCNASDVEVKLPKGVEALVESKSSISNLDIVYDMVKINDKLYKTENYDSSEDKITILVDGNVADITIR